MSEQNYQEHISTIVANATVPLLLFTDVGDISMSNEQDREIVAKMIDWLIERYQSRINNFDYLCTTLGDVGFDMVDDHFEYAMYLRHIITSTLNHKATNLSEEYIISGWGLTAWVAIDVKPCSFTIGRSFGQEDIMALIHNYFVDDDCSDTTSRVYFDPMHQQLRLKWLEKIKEQIAGM